MAPGKWVLAECSTALPKCEKNYTGRQQRTKGTRYDQDDWRVAAVRYGRVGDDEGRLIFRAAPEGPEEGGVDLFNSTEPRHAFSESGIPMVMGAEGQTCTWWLSRKAEAEGRS